MRFKTLLAVSILLACSFVFIGSGTFQTCQPIDRKQLREMVTQLGYEIKDIVTEPGKEKFSVTLTREGLDIPVAEEISANGKFIWLTVNLGPAKPEDGARNLALLKQTASAQPCHFYITEKGTLMMGLPVENRGINNAMLRERIENIAGKVGESKALWQ